jgi:hypothetical protein
MGEKTGSPSYVSEKVTTPSLLASKNAACFCSSVMPPAPDASPYAYASPPAFPAGIGVYEQARDRGEIDAGDARTEPAVLPENVERSRSSRDTAAAGSEERRGRASISSDFVPGAASLSLSLARS